MRLGDAVPRRPGHAPYLVPYVLVDRRRGRELGGIVRALRDGGASALELGFPFSDPIADGPVLAAAGARALAAGTAWTDLLKSIRVSSRLLPTAVMTYANPVLSRGLARAMAELRSAGAGGLIVPDLSWDDGATWRSRATAAGIDLVAFLAPGVAPARAERIARGARGFLYLVSRYGTTGSGEARSVGELRAIVREAHRVRPGLAVLVGFGVRDPASRARAIATGADGVIVGTALEEQLARGVRGAALVRFLARIRTGRRST